MRLLDMLHVFGCAPERAVWGLQPLDLGCTRVKKLKLGSVKDDPSHERGHEHGHHTTPPPFHSMPRARSEWGVKPGEVHPLALDLFMDLVYVGLAVNLGGLVRSAYQECAGPGAEGEAHSEPHGEEGSGHPARALNSHEAEEEEPCDGLGIGVVYFYVLFACFFKMWRIATFFVARFKWHDVYHTLLYASVILVMVIASANIRPIHELEENNGFLYVLVPILFCISLGTFIFRAEVALFSPHEATRRAMAFDIVTDIPSALFWGATGVLTYHQEHRRTFDDEVVRWLAPALLYMGAEWDMWRNLAIARIEGWVKSAHPEVRARQRALFPSSRTKVPANVEYFAHRHHEFILLMLGESILQLVIANSSLTPASDLDAHAEFYATLVGGFTIAACLLYATVASEPHDREHHAVGRSRHAAVLFIMFFELKAASILLVGIGIEVAVAEPGAVDEFFSSDQRWALGVPLAGAFLAQMVLKALHSRSHYNGVLRGGVCGKQALITAYLLGVCACILSFCVLSMPAWAFVLLQAGLSLLFCAGVYAESLPFCTRSPRARRTTCSTAPSSRNEIKLTDATASDVI